ncbi:MAG: D-alanyl-D-alanine carboxypeptidase [Myxococcales bacterium]|nr:D-alanyl-D-alanine carboxypeptidase [Myxococcales bacterium]
MHAMWGHVVLVMAALLSGESIASAKPSTKAATNATAPDVRSSAFWVMDAKTGATIAGRGADEARPIASTSKVFVALVVRQRGLKLDDWTTISQSDADRAKGGARTRLYVDEQYTNHDLLRAMLIASDNRAPSALGRAVGLTDAQLIAAVNAYAKKMGLTRTHFTDTSGLLGNTSTPRELALALREALKDPVLAKIMTTQETKVTAKTGKVVVYRNTNRTLFSSRYPVLGGKTGYTDLAGHCFVIAARIGGRDVVMSFLGGFGKLTRFADFSRVATWMEQRKLTGPSVGAPVKASDATKSSSKGSPGKGELGKRKPAARAAVN